MENYYYKHKEQRLKYQKEYNKQHKEHIQDYQAQYYLGHRFRNTKRYQHQNMEKVTIVQSITVSLKD
jgi:hypothetical protein